MSVQRIHDLVMCGRISVEEGAMLLQLRDELAWRRRPRWQRLAIVLLWGRRT